MTGAGGAELWLGGSVSLWFGGVWGVVRGGSLQATSHTSSMTNGTVVSGSVEIKISLEVGDLADLVAQPRLAWGLKRLMGSPGLESRFVHHGPTAGLRLC